jgi:uncharacterized protein YbjT (DUF2867 family)
MTSRSINPTSRTLPILVTGATGQQGGGVARELLRRGHSVRVLVRDPEAPGARELAALGALPVRGDLDDAEALRAAVAGTRGVFSVQPLSPDDPEAEVRRGIAVADAVHRAEGVEHLVYASVGGAERNSGIPHFETKWRVEQHIRELGLPATVLRPVFFMTNFGFFGPSWQEGRLVYGNFVDLDRTLQMIDPADVGWFAAEAFENPGEYVGRAIELAGDELTAQQIAEEFAAVAGTPVTAVRLPDSELEKWGEDGVRMYGWFNGPGYAADLPALRRSAPGLRTARDWLRESGWTAPAAPAAPEDSGTGAAAPEGSA